jgi:hypothetical protein
MRLVCLDLEFLSFVGTVYSFTYVQLCIMR